jgi:hypothetical protein
MFDVEVDDVQQPVNNPSFSGVQQTFKHIDKVLFIELVKLDIPIVHLVFMAYLN